MISPSNKLTSNQASNRKLTYPIVGMHCASCAKLIERKLSKVPGVSSANVNYGNETAYVEVNRYKDIKILSETENEIKKAVEDLGYKILINNQSSSTNNQTIEKIKNTEIKNLKIKVTLSLIAAAVLMFSMFFSLPFSMYYIPVISILIQIFIGAEFYQSLWSDIRNLAFGMNSLVAIGTTAAIIGGYYESSVTILALILLGRFLELSAKTKTGDAIKKLLEIKGTEMEKLMIGDIVHVKPGAKIATDGEVVTGESYVDESLITGESVPVKKVKGDKVFGGTINTTGAFSFVVTKVGSETLISQIIEMVSAAQGSRAEIQNLADKVSYYFVPTILVLGLITAFAFGLTNAIAVLVIACPCAMGLATPTAIMVGVGRGAKNGILIKDAQSLEILSKVKTIVFDKTGTLTVGKIFLRKISDGISNFQFPISNETSKLKLSNNLKKALQIAASLEAHSSHPIAQAIKYPKLLKVTKFKNIEGEGVEGVINGKKYFIGKSGLAGIALIVHRGLKDEQKLAEFEVADQLKEDVFDVIQKFHNKKIETWMITGDKRETAEVIAKEAGITNVLAGVMPGDKSAKIKQIQVHGLWFRVRSNTSDDELTNYEPTNHRVAFVGDGVNDAPALASADVGIAMGTGTDVAIESAGITLMNKDFKSVLTAYNLSRATMNTILTNLVWAFGYNAILIPVAMFGLLSPILAAGAMSLSSISVVLNSLRLNKVKI